MAKGAQTARRDEKGTQRSHLIKKKKTNLVKIWKKDEKREGRGER